MKNRTSIFIICLISSLLIISGCGNQNENGINKPVEVVVQSATVFSDGGIIPYSGTIEESESVPLSFASMGTVLRVLVAEGDYVKKGQLLAELNDETYKNSYEMSLAMQKQAEDAYKRLQPMYKNGNLPEIKFIEAETNLQKAKSSTAIAKKSLNDCKLYSTVNGIVGKRSIDPGMTALPNAASINIVKIEKVFARVPVSENEIASIKRGQKADITIAALNNSQFTGVVEEIGVMADPIAHTYKIKIAVSNNKFQIKPGMVCSVLIKGTKGKEGVIVPDKSVMVDENGKNYLFTVNTAENKALRKYVKTGSMLKEGIEITEGLSAGELVVVTGQHKLVDNSTVQITNK